MQLLRSRRTRAVLIALASLCLGLLLFFRDPQASRVYPPCVFRAVTRIHCAGCGTARALQALMHGNVAQAIAFNVLTLAYLPFFAFAYAREVRAAFWRKPPAPQKIAPVWTIWAHLGVIVTFWILRNVPVYPLTLLAPHRLS